jgi:hypothetical protein
MAQGKTTPDEASIKAKNAILGNYRANKEKAQSQQG